MRTKPVPTPPPNDATLPFLKYPITPPITITSPYGIVKQKSCIFPGFLGFQDQDFAGLSQIKQRAEEERKESSANQLSLEDQKWMLLFPNLPWELPREVCRTWSFCWLLQYRECGTHGGKLFVMKFGQLLHYGPYISIGMTYWVAYKNI